MPLQVTVGGLTFDGNPGAGQYATYTIGTNGLKGWFEGLEARHEMFERPVGDGDFDAPVRFGGRVITLTGSIRADNDVAFETAVAALETLLDDGSAAVFTVTQALGTFSCTVRRHGTPDIDVTLYGRKARYLLQFWAPDPTKVAV